MNENLKSGQQPDLEGQVEELILSQLPELVQQDILNMIEYIMGELYRQDSIHGPNEKNSSRH